MKPNWHTNLVILCEKCGKKLETSDVKNPSLRLKDEVKKKLIERSLWGSTRVVTSSCLDLCPEGKLAVAFVSDQLGRDFHIEAIDPKIEFKEFLKKITDRTPHE